MSRSAVLLLVSIVTLFLLVDGFSFSLVPALAYVKRSLRSVDNLSQLITCNKMLVSQQPGRHPEFVTCLMTAVASKDMHHYDPGKRLPLPGFVKLGNRQFRAIPIAETKIAVKLSHLSYLDKHSKEFTLGHFKELPTVVESPALAQTRAHVWTDAKSRTAFVSFRGTSSWMDVMHDLDTRPVPADPLLRPNASIHAGFRLKFFSVKKQLEDLLIHEKGKFDKIIITGHSLGGALATIAAPFLAELFPSKSIKCISFGAPRVGNDHFVEWFREKVQLSVRIVNEHDPVPHLPLGLPFHHVSDGLCIVSDSDVYGFPEMPVGRRIAWAMEHLDLAQVKPSHDLLTYIDRVNMYN